MSKKATVSDFLSKAKIVHGDRYDYKFSIYEKYNVPMQIICKKHGIFTQLPHLHLRGKGCKACGVDSNREKHLITQEEWLSRAIKKHGDTYDYSEVKYINSKIKVNILCKTHGVFLQKPSTHLEGFGCKKCTSERYYVEYKKTDEDFKSQIKKVHEDKYIYLNNYEGWSSRLKILCGKCNETFYQSASSHLSGAGCPKCSYKGWKDSDWEKHGNISVNFKSFKAYLIKMWNNNEIFYKIGKTFTDINLRFSSGTPYQYQIIQTIEGDAKTISDLERTLHKECKYYKYKPLISFKGETECFKFTPEVKQIFQQLAC
jgi:hypothetical protein